MKDGTQVGGGTSKSTEMVLLQLQESQVAVEARAFSLCKQSLHKPPALSC